MRFVLCWTVLWLCQFVLSKPTLPNIGFLGRGYDLVKGNPQPAVSDGVDHGWVSQIMNLTYNDGDSTSDQRYSIPDGTEGESESGCDFTGKAYINHGQQSYSSYLSTSISYSESENAIIEKESFSASTTFATFSESTYSYGNIYVATQAVCPAYEASIVPNELKVRSDFINEAQELPLTFNPKNSNDPYYTFIRNYGTNYATSIYMGSKYTRTYEFSSQTWTSMNWDKWDISTTASVEYAVATESVSTNQQGLVNQSMEYSKISSNFYQTVLGTTAVGINGNLSIWAEQSKNDPYPYSYNLNGINYVFQSKFMPNVKNITQKQALMVQALNNYCGVTSGCGQHSNDVDPLVIQEYNATISHGNINVQCPQGFVAISCGYQNINDGHDQYEKYWSVYPLNEYTCTGYNYYNAKIFAVCAPSDIATGWTVSKETIPHGGNGVDSKCPSSHKVTGCGITNNNDGDGHYEKYKQVYPLSDGSGCHCYDYYGGECYATCLSSVNNSRVYQQSGTGTITQGCEGEPIVFGCGILLKNLGNGDWEKYPQFWANNYNSCAGYSYYSFNLYSICGSLGNSVGLNYKDKIKTVYSQ